MRPTTRARLTAGFTVLALCAAACSSSEPDDINAFCEALARATSTTGAIAVLEIDDPVVLDSALADLDALVETAPEEIEADATVVAETFADIITALAGTAPGARNDVARDFQERIDEAAPSAAALERYGATSCDVTFVDPAAPTPTPTPLDIDD